MTVAADMKLADLEAYWDIKRARDEEYRKGKLMEEEERDDYDEEVDDDE
jgi:hypothetical protein